MNNSIADLIHFDMGDEMDNLDLSDIEVLSISDAMALPETGASSLSSSCNSSSCCGSSSCFHIT